MVSNIGLNLAKILILLILIVCLAIAGFFIFDRIGVLPLPKQLDPISNLMGFKAFQTASITDPNLIDKDRMVKNLDTLQNKEYEVKQREEAVAKKEEELKQLEQRLKDQEDSFKEREATLNSVMSGETDKAIILDTQAKYLSGMAPNNAVMILLGMNDQQIIEVLKATDVMAARDGVASMSAVWLQMMAATPATTKADGTKVDNGERVATILRKMAISDNF